MKTFRTMLCGALAVAALASPLAAWDSVGHQVVAEIAWENMSPSARDRAVALLRAAPPDADLANLSTDGRELFLLASTWPDIVRDRDKPERQAAYHRSSWHYTNFFWEPGIPPKDRNDLQPGQENVVKLLEKLEKDVVDSGRGDAQKAVDLAWILHLVGDIHQPLHTSARVTPTEPEGDRGGNLFLLTKEEENLHWYWDSILPKIWYRRGLDDTALARKIARELTRQFPEEQAGLKTGDFAAWAQEGLEKAKTVVYPPGLERGKRPAAEYRWQAYATVKPALARAGYRLAAMLDELLGGS